MSESMGGNMGEHEREQEQDHKRREEVNQEAAYLYLIVLAMLVTSYLVILFTCPPVRLVIRFYLRTS